MNQISNEPEALNEPDLDVPESDASLSDTLSRLAGSARTLADAEITLAKKRGSILVSAAQRIALFGIVAVIVIFAMIVTLMIGAVLALAPLWGLGLALLAVTGGALVAVIVCGLAIRAQVGRIKEGLR